MGQSERVWHLQRLRFLAGVIVMSLGACASEATTTSATNAPSDSVAVPDDRSLDVSYFGGTIELSFALLGQPFRAMSARVMTWSNGAWRYFGILRSADANTVGELTKLPQDQVEILDGVNTQPAPDRYDVSDLPLGRYLICTSLVGTGENREVCGELTVG